MFLRRSSIEEQTLLAVVNFSNLAYKNHKIGVPFPGKYKEILNSDAVSFGGEGNVNPRVKNSRQDECDELPNSIRITVPPLGISIFRCSRVEPAKETKEPKRSASKTAGQLPAEKGRSRKEGGGQRSGHAPAGTASKKSLKEELEEKVQREDYR